MGPTAQRRRRLWDLIWNASRTAHSPPLVRSRIEVIADLASSQRGLITRWQLIDAGVPASTIGAWLDRGYLHRVLRGVYLVGHSVPPEHARALAATLAWRAEALLSHRAAIFHWNLLEGEMPRVLEVTVLGPRVSGPAGVRAHFTKHLEPDERSIHQGVPVTSPARTLIDFAAQGSAYQVAKAYEEGLIRKYYDREDIGALLERHSGRRGIKKIRALYERDAPPSVTYREAHKRLLELIRSSDLPHPETEVRIGRHRVDILWREAKLVVEMDGAAFHSTPARIEADKKRDAELAALGYLVIRVTWRQLVDEPHAVISRIALTLGRRAAMDAQRTR